MRLMTQALKQAQIRRHAGNDIAGESITLQGAFFDIKVHRSDMKNSDWL